MIRDTLSPAVVAPLKVSAKLRGAAVKEVRYDPVLIRPQGICVSVISDMFLENICYL